MDSPIFHSTQKLQQLQLPQEQHEQQPQKPTQAPTHDDRPVASDQTCCSTFPKVLEGKSRTAAYVIGVAILLLGIVTLIIGIVGFFNNTTYIYQYYYDSYYHIYLYVVNPTAYVGANIWCGIFVSANLIK